MNVFTRNGISFRYPENWQVEVDESPEGGWAVTVNSPLTAFVVVSLQPDAGDPAELADQTLAAFKAEYEDLDSENRLETIAGRMAMGHDIDFLTLDTPITCRTRCLETLAGPLLLMTQVSEFDREANDLVLRAVVASLQLEED